MWGGYTEVVRTCKKCGEAILRWLGQVCEKCGEAILRWLRHVRNVGRLY